MGWWSDFKGGASMIYDATVDVFNGSADGNKAVGELTQAVGMVASDIGVTMVIPMTIWMILFFALKR